jgi:hypothetical protein
MLRQDQFHSPLEDGARRPGAGGEPFIELGCFYAQVSGEPVAAALQVLALLQDAGAHFCPSRLVDHSMHASNSRTYLRKSCTICRTARAAIRPKPITIALWGSHIGMPAFWLRASMLAICVTYFVDP